MSENPGDGGTANAMIGAGLGAGIGLGAGLPLGNQMGKQMQIDKEGLDEMDRKYMKCIALDFNGGPVGIETISAALLEQRDIIEDVIEPYLMQKGLVQRTSRGRILSKQGLDHISNYEKWKNYMYQIFMSIMKIQMPQVLYIIQRI